MSWGTAGSGGGRVPFADVPGERTLSSDDVTVGGNGLEHLAQTLAGYRTACPRTLRADALRVMGGLTSRLRADESVVCFCQAKRHDSEKLDVVVVMTGTDLLMLDGGPLVVEPERFELGSLRLREWGVERKGGRLLLDTPRGPRTFKEVIPATQGIRIARRLGLPYEREKLQLLKGEVPDDPGHPPVSMFWNLVLYRDRLVDQTQQHLPFTGHVEATVDTAGNLAVTRGRNLGAKAAGTLLLGPFGLLMAGNAKRTVTDTRETYLLVEGPGWAYTQKFVPQAGQALRQFAALLHGTARSFWEGRQPPPSPTTDLPSQLRELAELRTSGALTEEEFAAAKAKLLAD